MWNAARSKTSKKQKPSLVSHSTPCRSTASGLMGVNEMNANVPMSLTVGGFMKRERSSWGRKQDCWQTHLLASTPLTLGSHRAEPSITVPGCGWNKSSPSSSAKNHQIYIYCYIIFKGIRPEWFLKTVSCVLDLICETKLSLLFPIVFNKKQSPHPLSIFGEDNELHW